MKTLVAFIVFGFIALAIIAIIVINVLYRNMKRMREDAEDFFYRRDRRNEQKDRNPFGEDYFKSSRKTDSQDARRAREKQQKTTRRTTTSGGVTIIDERQEDKKIFDKGDDEYVEFEEVR
ncbi:DUF4834 family protein [Prevotella sp. P6B1]|uniref:DUF4834 family protein n=1 Tax=Prevotella sp. P6B1 TaxID=1410613 RepID=UPI000AF270C8|nr:DUF4834 family protein [Prevotella sp. P6B1]